LEEDLANIRLLLCSIINAALQHWQFSCLPKQRIFRFREANEIKKGYKK